MQGGWDECLGTHTVEEVLTNVVGCDRDRVNVWRRWEGWSMWTWRRWEAVWSFVPSDTDWWGLQRAAARAHVHSAGGFVCSYALAYVLVRVCSLVRSHPDNLSSDIS